MNPNWNIFISILTTLWPNTPKIKYMKDDENEIEAEKKRKHISIRLRIEKKNTAIKSARAGRKIDKLQHWFDSISIQNGAANVRGHFMRSIQHSVCATRNSVNDSYLFVLVFAFEFRFFHALHSYAYTLPKLTLATSEESLGSVNNTRPIEISGSNDLRLILSQTLTSWPRMSNTKIKMKWISFDPEVPPIILDDT